MIKRDTEIFPQKKKNERNHSFFSYFSFTTAFLYSIGAFMQYPDP